jgi:Putative peptidoglycan binding domain
MKSCFQWLVAAAVAASLPVTAQVVTGHGMGGGGHGMGGGGHGMGGGGHGMGGGGSHHSIGGAVRGGPHVFTGQRFGQARFFDRGRSFDHDRFFDHHRFGNHDRFFRHHRHIFVAFDFVAFGYPWWYPDWYWYPDDYYDYDYGPAYDYQYWENLAESVQSELARRGYYHGAIDGVIGSGSRQAIQAFQTAQGLPVTGLIDPKLLKALGISYKKA